MIAKKPAAQAAPLRFDEAACVVAWLGGSPARRAHVAPGVKTLQIGCRRGMHFGAGIKLAKEANASGVCAIGMGQTCARGEP